MRILEITGDRRSGKTHLLTDHVARMLSVSDTPRILIICDGLASQQVLMQILSGKVRAAELKTVEFCTIEHAATRMRGRHYDGVYIDCSEELELEAKIRLAVIVDQDGILVTTKETGL